jgi:hypothetical protein
MVVVVVMDNRYGVYSEGRNGKCGRAVQSVYMQSYPVRGMAVMGDRGGRGR